MAREDKAPRDNKGLFVKTGKRIPNCIKCGASDSSIQIVLDGAYKGLCVKCRRSAYYKDNKEKENAKCREYYHTQDGLLRMKERWFGGNYMKRLDIDKHKCALCQSPDNLQIHHIDHSGIKSKGSYKKSNNKLSNLITLCDTCHSIYHANLLQGNYSISYEMKDRMLTYQQTLDLPE